MSAINDSRTIQQLVDGELEPQRRSELLQVADQHPELWRSIALAFVEDRLWRQYTLNEVGRWDVAADKTVESKLPRRPWRQPAARPWWVLLAASLLVAATLVVRARLPGEPVSHDRNMPAAPETLVQSPNYTLRLHDQEIPLYSQIDRLPSALAQTDIPITPALQRRFLRSGYQIEPQVRFISGQAPDGRSFIVPVRGVRVFPYVQ